MCACAHERICAPVSPGVSAGSCFKLTATPTGQRMSFFFFPECFSTLYIVSHLGREVRVRAGGLGSFCLSVAPLGLVMLELSLERSRKGQSSGKVADQQGDHDGPRCLTTVAAHIESRESERRSRATCSSALP